MKLYLLLLLGLTALTLAEPPPSLEALEASDKESKDRPSESKSNKGEESTTGSHERGLGILGWGPKPKPKPRPAKCSPHKKFGLHCSAITTPFWYKPFKKCVTKKCWYSVSSGYLYVQGQYIYVPFIWPYSMTGSHCLKEYPCAPNCTCRTKYCVKREKKWVNINGRYYKLYVWIKYPCGCDCRKKKFTFPFDLTSG